MEIIEVYKCLCDIQRLRILNLLKGGPLCVCHLIEVLDAGSVKISKQLRYMKELGMVEVTREANWMIYSLPQPPNPLVIQNLKCLQDCADEHVCFGDDLKKRAEILARIESEQSNCPQSVLSANSECC
ncbi:metalloregulator ArsR/SmtB family transcription factor [Rubellicoccus peritrichatus]|uniref:Metalloregulator ArsR/SmtB family transcription factor n=1 Tax=Rubellicoccus peritrichatus TaxID=3080537 RepID=A0AAQ3LF89_9BACT|nr:metalloregulator ArsR/SmtB family transcription factor [Puniceicoccus sp. CR14]WOO40879.1 metalloregulator ArsR/SmtB family transcription factor [Puniceicoccus sp. CR14]